jgi:hypothetical protein
MTTTTGLYVCLIKGLVALIILESGSVRPYNVRHGTHPTSYYFSINPHLICLIANADTAFAQFLVNLHEILALVIKDLNRIIITKVSPYHIQKMTYNCLMIRLLGHG